LYFFAAIVVVMQLLIGFETGLIVLWDLGEKAAEFRYNSTEVCIECRFFTVCKTALVNHRACRWIVY